MGSYHYRRDSPLTRWQQEKAWSLCCERHPILIRRWSGKERPNDKLLLRHIEREIDWYHMKAAKPGLDAMAARLRKANALNRKIQRLIALASPPSSPGEKGGAG